jgi:hypothetical protein
MLEPKNRRKLMEQFRPDDGYTLDRALGTTFSLDLVSLLIAPFSMALFECDDKDEVLKDPTAILEALRLMSDRVTVFCQKGRIIAPRTDNYLFSYLEPMVIEVEPEDQNGVFHPKVWVLRYINEEQNVRYRFLCLSRNLTFDHSWDTILTIEGDCNTQRKLGYSKNKPLCDFLKSLPGLAKGTPESVRSMIDLMTGEVSKVDFLPPDPFTDILFHPIGITGYKRGVEVILGNRQLVISPFLSDEIVKELSAMGQNNILVSRPESLDALNSETLKQVSQNTKIYIMQQTAEKETDSKDESDDDIVMIDEDDPSGLHAKLYISEEGWDGNIFTGSANATHAGLNGVNVEFLTQLVGKKSQMGIDCLLDTGKDTSETTLSNLLAPYNISSEKNDEYEKQRKLTKVLDAVRRQLSRANLLISIAQGDGKTYVMKMTSGGIISFPDNILIVCWPIMLPETQAKDFLLIFRSELMFKDLTMLALTRFFAFKVTAQIEDKKGSIKFALNLPVEGMPEERSKFVLQHIIGNSDRFIRYLMFLLSDNPEELIIKHVIHGGNSGRKSPNDTGMFDIPLFEELVRAYSRHPEKIMHIDKLVTDLKKMENGAHLFPSGFDDIWTTFKKAIPMEKT